MELWYFMAILTLISARRGERPKYMTAYACEGSKLHIKCDEGQLINLIRANYGRFSISICNEHGNLDWSVDCMSHRSFREMQQRCSLRTQCIVKVDSDTFGDGCPDTYKYLEVQYTCTLEATTAIATRPSPPIIFPPTVPIYVQSSTLASQTVPDLSSATSVTEISDISPQIKTSLTTKSSMVTPAIINTYSVSSLSTPVPTKSHIMNKANKNSVKITHQSPIEDNSIRHCPRFTARNVIWSRTSAGVTSKQLCPGGTTGEALWYCDERTLKWNPSHPDMSDCKSLWLISLKERLQHGDSVINIAVKLAVMAKTNMMYGGDLMQVTDIIQQLVLKMANRIIEYPDGRQRHQIVMELVQSIVDICNSLLDDFQNDAWNDLPELNRRTVASALLREMEQSALLLAESQDGENHFSRVQDNVLMTVTVSNVNSVTSMRLPSADDIFVTPWSKVEDFIFIPRQTLLDSARNGMVKIIYLSYKKLANILDPSPKMDQISYYEMPDSINEDKKIQVINSRIVTASLGRIGLIELSEPIAIILKNSHDENNDTKSESLFPCCVYWDFELRSWSDNGCWVQTFNRTHTVCRCNHLTNFAAVLMKRRSVQLSYKNETSLIVVTYIGCIISIACLLLTVLAFQIFREIKNDHITIHKNLCICLLIAETIFIGGINQTHLRILCGIVAGLLHYFFLSAFLWMLLEGFHIYILLVEVFESEKSRIKWYYAIAYLLPAIIVGISAAVDPYSFGTEQHCWLRADNYFIFSFIGPLILVVMINFFFLGFSAFIICHRKKHNSTIKTKEQSKLANTKNYIRGASMLVMLLTITWIFGVIYLRKESIIMAYIFTVFNSLQGLFIFIYHCMKNEKLQKEYEKFIHRSQWLPECVKNTKSGDSCSSFYIHSTRTPTAPTTSATHSSLHQAMDVQKEQPSTSNITIPTSIVQDLPSMTLQQRLSRERTSMRSNQGTQKKLNTRTSTMTKTSDLDKDIVQCPKDYNCDKVIVAANLHEQQPGRIIHTPYSHMLGHSDRYHSYIDHIYETIDDDLDVPSYERRMSPYGYHAVVPEGHIRTHSDASRQSSSSFNCDHHPLLPPILPQRNALTALAQVLNSAPRQTSSLTQDIYCQRCSDGMVCHHHAKLFSAEAIPLSNELDTCSTLPIRYFREKNNEINDGCHQNTVPHSDRIAWNTVLPDIAKLSNDSAVLMAVLDGQHVEHVICKPHSDIANKSKSHTTNHQLTTDC
ncbi:latrophilin Cirl-like isoform X3 [Centruroides sculpturatus]|uniref:latrophilin Cirl-like isoform X3 n=1 Tax=Centruroides sculpturatus TaxID=218467 RepID=UPI000C6E8E82|nr:latrophilin Cirl-like isoform X3 [Centruroides sculpturatus]